VTAVRLTNIFSSTLVLEGGTLVFLVLEERVFTYFNTPSSSFTLTFSLAFKIMVCSVV